ncbi:Gfo/Idh/MocA family oxidoreductase [Aequorivita antarctica]|uniref:Gfo/Idh/MocA family oxidoreductase n=1 Tax=Aequorivita antarctica TaxID=153266 RepID=A0A5C6Z569_9FLAO|nr:hypothetical protein [Aequorivita antarctica]TXD74776.1 hypothetical protein ESU54_00870 [Aequorivita antarctica]SRX72521.1 hypothetical protein AEQU3_00343 [Aequorivita antarctica]
MVHIVKFKDIEFDELVSIEQEVIFVSDRPEFTNKYRKLLFFAFREGIFRTFYKIRSKTNPKLNLEKRFTLIIIKHKNSLYTNFSTQTTENKDEFVINNNFTKVLIVPKINDITSTQKFNQFVEDGQNETDISFNIKTHQSDSKVVASQKGVFIYGLGDYSRVYIAQNIKMLSKIFCVDYSHQLSKYYYHKFGYEKFGIIPEDSYPFLPTIEKPLAIIATYHSDHTRIAKEIFDINPNTFIFIEKPPCVTLQDIKTLVALYNDNALIEIGYNRRFIPVNQEIRAATFKQQKIINISAKEILINESHWYFWKNQGTRITGNLTHWIDLAVYWINGSPIEINLLSSPSKDETIALSILFSEGSLVNISVSDKGNSLRGVQEHIEIRTENETFFIEDYLKYTRVKSDGSKTTKRNLKRDKGHDAMYKHLTKVYNNEKSITYTKSDLIKSALTTYHVSRMYQENVRNFKMNQSLSEFN